MDLERTTTHGKDIGDTSTIEKYFDKWAPDYHKDLSFAGLPKQLEVMYSNLGLKETKQVMDFGCGTGIGGQWFVENGITVNGCDLSTRMLQRAQQVGYSDLEQADLTKPFNPSKPFDTAISIGVMGDYVHPEQLLPSMITKTMIFTIEGEYVKKYAPDLMKLLPEYDIQRLPDMSIHTKDVVREVLITWIAKRKRKQSCP